MRVIEAVNHAHIRKQEVSVFLAGGITDCPDWQADVIKAFDKHLRKLPIVLLNPRRADFPMNDPNASQAQIEWEFDMLQRADVILFWFPKETLCPITLYELGFQMGRRFGENATTYPHIAVGTHPEYKRKQDVVIQTYLVDSRLTVHSTFSGLVTEAMNMAADVYNRKPTNSDWY